MEIHYLARPQQTTSETDVTSPGHSGRAWWLNDHWEIVIDQYLMPDNTTVSLNGDNRIQISPDLVTKIDNSENVANKVTEIGGIGTASDTNYPTELAIANKLFGVLSIPIVVGPVTLTAPVTSAQHDVTWWLPDISHFCEYSCKLRCISAEGGYAVGDWIAQVTAYNDDTGDSPLFPIMNATTISVRLGGSIGAKLTGLHKTTAKIFDLTLNKWQAYFIIRMPFL